MKHHHDTFESRSVMRRIAHQAPNVLIAENEKLNSELTQTLKLLESVLFVMNEDSDGDYFICREAKDIIDKASALVMRKNGF